MWLFLHRIGQFHKAVDFGLNRISFPKSFLCRCRDTCPPSHQIHRKTRQTRKHHWHSLLLWYFFFLITFRMACHQMSIRYWNSFVNHTFGPLSMASWAHLSDWRLLVLMLVLILSAGLRVRSFVIQIQRRMYLFIYGPPCCHQCFKNFQMP